MSGIFIEKVELENYKCFQKNEVNLSVPDGATLGSGLNLLIGENGNGKTALLEAIDYTNRGSYSAENRLQSHDFTDYRKPIKVRIKTNDFTCKMSAPYIGCSFDCNGVEFQAKNRDRKSSGKLLSPPFSISTSVKTKSNSYKNKGGVDTGKEIPGLHKMFSNASIDGSELNIFYFDKSRARQLSTGTYKTTFERICDDLNWKFIKNLDDTNKATLLKNISGEYFSNVISVAQKGVGNKLAEEMAEFFGQDQYKDLRIDLLDLLHPFSKSFFSIRGDGEFTQITPRELGSGIEIILTLLLLRSVASASKGGIVYLLDEPELHLHPMAQQRLVNLLLEESRDKQIIIATHSPYLIKGCMLPSVNKIVLRRDDQNEIQIENVSAASWGRFPWSPSWGEVNYVAYGLATVEYHNELYGWLQEKHHLATEAEVEVYLVGRGIDKTKKWTRVKSGKTQPPYDITLCSYVRNSIHHPENTQNVPYTEAELEDSIEMLMAAI